MCQITILSTILQKRRFPGYSDLAHFLEDVPKVKNSMRLCHFEPSRIIAETYIENLQYIENLHTVHRDFAELSEYLVEVMR